MTPSESGILQVMYHLYTLEQLVNTNMQNNKAYKTANEFEFYDELLILINAAKSRYEELIKPTMQTKINF